MNAYALEITTQTRQNILEFCSDLSIKELNQVPIGLNNNIIWNVGHIIVTQEILFYKFSKLQFSLPENFIEKYRKGTKPGDPIEKTEWDFIKHSLLQTVDVAFNRYEEKAFVHYDPFKTSYGTLLSNIDDAITFNNVHEAMHFGYLKAIGKLVRS